MAILLTPCSRYAGTTRYPPGSREGKSGSRQLGSSSITCPNQLKPNCQDPPLKLGGSSADLADVTDSMASSGSGPLLPPLTHLKAHASPLSNFQQLIFRGREVHIICGEIWHMGTGTLLQADLERGGKSSQTSFLPVLYWLQGVNLGPKKPTREETKLSETSHKGLASSKEGLTTALSPLIHL